jgi:hypothetical protein
MVQFLASNTFVTNPAKIQMVGRDRSPRRSPSTAEAGRVRRELREICESDYLPSLPAQLLRQIAKPGDKLRFVKSTSCAITLLTKTEAFP